MVRYFLFSGLWQYYSDQVEPAWSVLDVVCGEEESGGAGEPGLLGVCEGRFRGGEIFTGPGFDLDEDDRPVGVDHDQIEFPGFACVVSGERFQAFAFEEFFAAFLSPSPESGFVGEEPGFVVQQRQH